MTAGPGAAMTRGPGPAMTADGGRPPRHEVAVLALPGTIAFELGLPHRLLGGAVDAGERPLYRVRVATLDGGPVRTSAGYAVVPEHDVTLLGTARTVVVPGVQGGPAMTDGRLPDELSAALRAAAGHARVLSICTGAFLVAAAGLLDGRRAATHWQFAKELRRAHPRVRVDADVLYVDDGPVLTSAGAAAGIDACLHVVRGEHGAAVANALARRMIVPAHRAGGQAQYVQSPVPEPEEDGELAGLLDWIEAHVDEPLTVDALAARALMSARTFARRFRAATGTTPHRYLLHRRLRLAEQLLETSDLPVDAIAGRVGFGSGDTLRHHFAAHRGIGPAGYRRTFRAARR